MLVTPPPDALGAANVESALMAMLALIAVGASVLILPVSAYLLGTLAGFVKRAFTPNSPRPTIMDVVMMPLEVDLATVGTLLYIQAAEALPAITMPLAALPPSSSSSSSGSSVALLDDDRADDADTSDTSWPPHPRTPGAKRYRYIVASGQFVKLADLHPYGIREPRWFELN